MDHVARAPRAELVRASDLIDFAITVRHQGSQIPIATVREDWNPALTAIIVCDMWDAHHCVSAAGRVDTMAPRIDVVLEALRARGALIVHSPAGCISYYDHTPARRRAANAPPIAAGVSFDWNDWLPDELAALPETLTSPGPCSCDAAMPCNGGGPPYPWTRQTSRIRIADTDAVTDDGQELYNLLEARRIDDVIVMGVHTNVCVLGRPYGIRQLVYLGKRPVLCRDLTDSFHRDPRGHEWGTDRIVAHIERRWCPTVTSEQLV